MLLPLLGGVVPVAQCLAGKLLAGEIKGVALHHIVAVIAAIWPEDAVDLPTKDVLDQEGCREALPSKD